MGATISERVTDNRDLFKPNQESRPELDVVRIE